MISRNIFTYEIKQASSSQINKSRQYKKKTQIDLSKKIIRLKCGILKVVIILYLMQSVGNTWM